MNYNFCDKQNNTGNVALALKKNYFIITISNKKMNLKKKYQFVRKYYFDKVPY